VSETPEVKKHTAWDAESGYGKHAYRKIDPSTVNPEDYAHSLRGDEKFYGDIRERNTGANEKHPETTVDLYDLGLIGTVFNTDAPGYEGLWIVTDLFVVHAPQVWCRAARVVAEAHEGQEGWAQVEPAKEISATDLGVTVDEKNLFKQVRTTLVHRGMIDRNQRVRAATGVKTRDRMKQEALSRS